MAKATVAAIISAGSDRPDLILLTKRSVPPFKGFWCLPGGHIDAGESTRAAVIREVSEETGITFIDPIFLCYSDEIFPEFGFHAVALAFYGCAAGSLQLMADEVESISWFPLHEAMELPLAFNHLQILQRYAQHLTK